MEESDKVVGRDKGGGGPWQLPVVWAAVHLDWHDNWIIIR